MQVTWDGLVTIVDDHRGAGSIAGRTVCLERPKIQPSNPAAVQFACWPLARWQLEMSLTIRGFPAAITHFEPRRCARKDGCL